eukprot:13114785-Alexandrium_andersonii.AAC.1
MPQRAARLGRHTATAAARKARRVSSGKRLRRSCAKGARSQGFVGHRRTSEPWPRCPAGAGGGR